MELREIGRGRLSRTLCSHDARALHRRSPRGVQRAGMSGAAALPSLSGDAQNPADEAEDMELRPYVRGGKAWARLHGAPIARERRPLRDLGAEAGKFHAREKHGPDHIGDAIGRRHHHRAAIAQRLLQPIHEADRFGAAPLRKPHDGSGIEGADPLGEDRGARLIDLREIGIFGCAREEAATGGFEVLWES
jgi:hypothetical protein